LGWVSGTGKTHALRLKPSFPPNRGFSEKTMSIKLREKEPTRFELPSGALVALRRVQPTVVVNSFPTNRVLQSMFIAVQTKNYK